MAGWQDDGYMSRAGSYLQLYFEEVESGASDLMVQAFLVWHIVTVGFWLFPGEQ